MEKYSGILRQTSIFNGISFSDIEKILPCLNGHSMEYNKGAYIYREGDAISKIGIVLKGEVHVIKTDYAGNENILANITPGNIFAESAACSGHNALPVNVITVTACEILFLDYKRIVSPCANTCGFHSRLIQNLVTGLADKNILLNRKLEYLSRRTTKEKLLFYLFDQSKANNNRKFKIPFNREQLANYLAVDRSAMSSELSKLRDAGVIKYHKNEFELIRR